MDAAFDGAGDRLVGVEMGGDIGMRVAGLLDDRLDLGARELEDMNRIGRRGDAAIGHDLDEARALPEFVARGLADGFEAVAEAAERAEPIGEIVGGAAVIAAAEVGVAAGLRQGLAADDEARSLDQPQRQGVDQRLGRAAEIAHRGEAAREHAAHDVGRAEGDERIRQAAVAAKIGGGRDDMDMAVDEAGHQRAALEIDAPCAGRGDRPIGDFRDPAALDAHEAIVFALRAAAVQDAGILEDDGRRAVHSAFPLLSAAAFVAALICSLRIDFQKRSRRRK